MPKTKSRLKKDSIRIHAKRRASERVGIELNKERRNTLINRVKKGTAEFIAKQSNRVSKWKSTFPDTDIEIVFIYDKIRKDIVTLWVCEGT